MEGASRNGSGQIQAFIQEGTRNVRHMIGGILAQGALVGGWAPRRRSHAYQDSMTAQVFEEANGRVAHIWEDGSKIATVASAL